MPKFKLSKPLERCSIQQTNSYISIVEITASLTLPSSAGACELAMSLWEAGVERRVQMFC